MKKFILFLFVSTVAQTAVNPCSQPEVKNLSQEFQDYFCAQTKTMNSPLGHFIEGLFSKDKAVSDWSISSQDWERFVQNFRLAKKLGFPTGEFVNDLDRVAKKVSEKDKAAYAAFLSRVSPCSDGETAEELSALLARSFSDNPVLAARSLAQEQERYELDMKNKASQCQKKIATQYLNPHLTSANLTLLMGEWEQSQPPQAIVSALSRETELKKDARLKTLFDYVLKAK